jgi:hypothetical protein
MTEEATEELDRYCDDNPHEDWCEWWTRNRGSGEHYGSEDRGSATPYGG